MIGWKSVGAGLVCGSIVIGSGVLVGGDRKYEGHSLAATISGFVATGMSALSKDRKDCAFRTYCSYQCCFFGIPSEENV